MRKGFLVACVLAAAADGASWSRPWKIYVAPHPHVDMGYTEQPAEVERNWCARIDQAMAATGRGFKWTLEASVLFEVYARLRPPEKVAELARLAREGKIEIAGLYTGLNSETTGAEELVRSTFHAAAKLRREFGITPHTAMLTDVAGATWGLPRVLAGAGIRYFAFAPGRYKQLFDLARHPELFYWKSPDGSRVLTRLGTGPYAFYGAGVMLHRPESIDRDVTALLRHYESLGGQYPYDAILLQDADDNSAPPVKLVDVISKWNATHANPRLVMATPAEFFRYVEGEYRDRIPELSGDFTSAWTDMPGNFAEATAFKRRAASEIVAAERFAALAGMMGTGFPYPGERIRSVYENLLRYSDHTFGIATWGWEHAALAHSGGDLSAPVWDFYRQSWEAKKSYAYRAAEDSAGMLGDALERLAANIPSRGRSIVVFNALSWPRTDVVTVLSRLVKVGTAPYRIVDAAGAEVPYQLLEGDALYSRIAFLARDVPALGYRSYRVERAAPAQADSAVKREGNVLENEFYRVELDPASGGVLGIFDKQLGRELADRKGAERVNQYFHYALSGSHEAIYNDARSKLGRIPAADLHMEVRTPRSARILAGHAGPVVASLRAEVRLTQEPATEIAQEVMLYPGIRRIDFRNRIRKQASVAKEEIYYSFPFQVDGSRMRVELPGAVMEPGRDQLPGSFTGFSAVEHWADVSNREFGVTVATREVPAVEFGEIRTNDWSLEYRPSRSAFFFYVMNNRWNTNQALWQGTESWRRGALEVNFSVTSHAGEGRAEAASRFGWQHNLPLMARVIEAAQDGALPAERAGFCDGLPEGVMLQALKQAEHGPGYIARFYETGGQARNVTWSGLPLKVREAYRTDLLENNMEPARVDGARIIFPIGAHQVLTLRLIP